MSARHKLNAAHLWGIFISALSLGFATQSLWVGLLTAVALYLINVHSGSIRRDEATAPPHRRRRRR